MTTETMEQEAETTDAMQDAFEDAAAEKLTNEPVADSAPSDEGEESATPEDSGPSEQGGLLPRMGDQAAFEGEGFEKPAKTRRQLADEFLEHFQSDVEKAETAVFNARRKLREAQVLRDDAEENLRRAIEAEKEEAGADEGDDETAAVEVDPITGEVASDVVEKTEPAADAPPLINVFWPDSSFPQETEVGQYTTYGELIADYLTASELDDDPAGYIVVGMASNHECSPKARILEGAYGHLFAVCRRGQTCDTCGRSCNVRQNHGQLVTGCHGRDWSAAVTCDTCAAPCALKLDEGSEKTGCGGNGWKGAAEEPAA